MSLQNRPANPQATQVDDRPIETSDRLPRGQGSPVSGARAERDGSHDFDFWAGRWRIRNERLVKRLQGCTEWETFEATNRARLLPGGLGNMDEFVTDHWPGFVGMSLRLYNPHTRKWSIHWASNQKGVLEPPVVGSFSGGVGVFEGQDELDGRLIVVRFTWSDITPTGARWEQGFSPDGGRTWEKNWIMTMTRLPEG